MSLPACARPTLLAVLLGLAGCAGLPPEPLREEAPCGWALEEWHTLDGGYLEERFVRLRQPVSVAADIDGLWFYDAGYATVFLLEAVSDRLRPVAAPSTSRETRLRLDGFGGLYLADPRSGALLRFDIAGGEAESLSREAALAPGAVALDREGRVLVGDSQAGRVLAFNALGGFEEPVAEEMPRLGGIAGLLARDEQLWIADPLERRVYLLTEDRLRRSFGHPDWISPGALADDGRGGVVMADTATRRLYRLTDEGAVAALTPAGLDVQRIDDLAGYAGELYLADGARGEIRVLRLTPRECPAGSDEAGDDS